MPNEKDKDHIKPMEKASEVISVLNPVTFRYKKEIDPAPHRSSDLWPRKWKR
jgi:Chaperone of endosialidase